MDTGSQAIVDVDVDVVTVTYNSPPLDAAFQVIASAPDMRLLVIDNHSQHPPRVPAAASLVVNDENLGYAEACNSVLNAGSAPYLLFLNPDCVVSLETIRTMVRSAETFAPTPVIMSPKALGAPGQRVIPAGREPSATSFLSQYLGVARLAGGGFNLYTGPGLTSGLIDVDWVGGGCLLISRRLFTSLRGFTDRYFMYGEDVDLCLRAKDSGARVLLAADLSAEHPIGTGSIADSALRMAWLRNLRDIVRRRRGSRALARFDLALRFGALVVSVLRVVGRRPTLGRPDLRMLRTLVLDYQPTEIR